MIARMNGEDYAIDSATLKANVCSASEFVAGSASRFCTRPSNHHGPHAFPVDPQTVLAQREVAKLREQLADLARVNAAELQRADLAMVEAKAREADLTAKLSTERKFSTGLLGACELLEGALRENADAGDPAVEAVLVTSAKARAGGLL